MIIHEEEQGTDEWHALRAGLPTASEADKLVTSQGAISKQMDGVALQCAVDLYAGEPLDKWAGNEWTDRGHEMEDRARAFYENTFSDRIVTQVGFITTDDNSAGASPDGLVDEGGMLEIKCLKATSHAKVLIAYERNGKLPATYICQPQMQMLVAERAWCDMVFWHPELPALIVRHLPDDSIITPLRVQIAKCITERDTIVRTLRAFANE